MRAGPKTGKHMVVSLKLGWGSRVQSLGGFAVLLGGSWDLVGKVISTSIGG